MKHKKKIFCRHFLVIAILLLVSKTSELNAQSATSSPYSRFGIGDLNSITFASNLALAGTEIGLNQPGHINYGNPAAYSALWFTTYEGGVEFKQSEFKTTNTRHRTFNSSVSYFDFAFPIKPQKWSLGFGLLPYSKVGYLVTSESENAFGDKVFDKYQGSGGLNNFHIGSGLKISKKLSFGINAEYLFGVINNDRTVSYSSIYYYGTSITSATSIGWFHFKTGIQFVCDSIALNKSDSIISLDKKISLLQDSLNNLIGKNNETTSTESYDIKNRLVQEIATSKEIKKNVVNKKVKSSWRLVLGLIATPETDLHASSSILTTSTRTKFYGTKAESTSVRDTIKLSNGERSYIRLPLSTGFGFSLQKGSRWLFGSDFTFQQWSRFSFLGNQDSLVNSWKITAGVQFTPNERAFKSFLKTIQYRLGFHYDSGYLKIYDTNIRELGLSAGFGIPIRKAGTLINITCEAGRKGTTQNNLILERYLKFTIGFTINDRWFIKSKYD